MIEAKRDSRRRQIRGKSETRKASATPPSSPAAPAPDRQRRPKLTLKIPTEPSADGD